MIVGYFKKIYKLGCISMTSVAHLTIDFNDGWRLSKLWASHTIDKKKH